VPLDPVNLLRKLEPPVRPASAPGPRLVARAPFERQGFDELLTLVSSGEIRSDRPLLVAADAGLTDALDDGQLARLRAATDLAQSSGASRAVMLLDGRGLVIDVAERQVTSELSSGRPEALVDVDAAVHVAAEGKVAASPAAMGPAAGLIPPGVAEQIAQAAHDAPSGAVRTDHHTDHHRPGRRAG